MRHDIEYLNTLDKVGYELDYWIKYLEKKILLTTNKEEIRVLNAEKEVFFNAKMKCTTISCINKELEN